MNRQRSSLSRLLIAMLCACILFSNSFPSALLADTQDISALPINNEIQSANSSQESTTGSQRVGKDIPQIDWASVPWQQTNVASPFETLNLNAATTIQITTEGFSPATLSVFGPTDVTWVNSTAVTQTIRSGKPTIIATPTSLPATATATAIPPTATFTPIPATATPVPNATPTANGSVYLPLVSRQQSALEQQNAATIPETTNASDLAADTILAILPPGAAYSKRYQEPGQFFFYLQDAPQFTGSVSLGGVGLLNSSPANGEGDVAVTRETILEFSGALDANSVNGAVFSATFSSKELATRLHLAADGRKVTLFYNDPLPANARVQVHIDGSKLKDNTGAMVDVDGDGQAGGQVTIDFDTLTLTVLPGTMVCGRVFASALKAVSYGVSGSSVSVNDPLQGVTISVDGQAQTLRTTTDAQGNFCLNPAPAGRFFVHVDGRTASNNVPAGSYYPFVGKAWDSIPGQTNNVGEIYLPLVPPDTLQAVSASQETVVYFAPSVLAEFPDFADVKITVPANSLYADDGTMGGKVGIAPVPPDRLPGQLPPGLNFPVVITVQTDGATNFDKPVSACFPNLPDKNSGQPLPANSKSALWSFNHDTGRFEIVGPMTVSADGKLVCTDAGVGIEAPGWHGTQPGASGNGGPPAPPPPPPCDPATRSCTPRVGWNPSEHFNGCGAQGYGDILLRILNSPPSLACSFVVPCNAHDIGYSTCMRPKQVTDDQFLSDLLNTCNSCGTLPRDKEICRTWANIYFQAVSKKGETPYRTAQEEACDYKCPNGSLLSSAQSSQSSLFPDLQLNQDDFTNSSYFYAVVNRQNQITLRGELPVGSNGFNQLILAPNTQYQIALLQAKTLDEGSVNIVTPDSGASFEIPTIFIQEPLGWDLDDDGLSEGGEYIVGTDIFKSDTNGDGINDGAEVQNGTDPLDGLPARTGIIGTADTPGTAVDVCATGDLVAVADSDAGVALFNVFNGMQPKLIAQVDTPGNASAVACSKDHVYVADGSGGLAVIDIRDPANAQIERRIPLATAQALAVALNHAYVASGSDLVLVDLNTGEVVDRLGLNATVEDVTISGDYLYALIAGTLFTLPLSQYLLEVVHQTSSPGNVMTGVQRLRLFAGANLLYATHTWGYNTFNLTTPKSPKLITTGTTQQIGWKHIVENGSGLGIAGVGVNGSGDGNVYLYDVSDPSQTNRFLTEFQTPGIAVAVALNNGLAFVADSQSGLQVINYVSYDSKGISPTISLTSNYAPGIVEENSTIRLTAIISDDVQVRNVEFYIDGVLSDVDGNYPFETRFTTTSRNSQPSFSVRSKATDTGGNFAWADTISYTLVADATPPRVLSVTPQSSAWPPPNTLNKISATFNESMDPASFTAATFQLFSSGSDKLLGTSDDQPVAGTVSYDEASKTASLTLPANLGAESYRVVLNATDLAGNPIKGGEYSWNVYIGILTWDGGGDNQSWHDPKNWSYDHIPTNGAPVVIDSAYAGAIVYSQGDVTLGSVQTNRPLQITGGKLAINGDSLLTSLSQAGGELSGSGVITVTNLTWTNGTMSGSGKTVVTEGMILGRDNDNGPITLSQRQLENAGSATWSGNHFIFNVDNAATFINRAGATFTNLTVEDDFVYSRGAIGQFVNYGTYTKILSKTTEFNIPFNNFGTIDLQMGGTTFLAGGRNSGTIKLAVNAKVGLILGNNYFLEPSTQLIGAGKVWLNTAPFTFGNNFAFTGDLLVIGGAVSFSTPVTLNSLTATGGSATFSSTLTTPNITISAGKLTLMQNTTVPTMTISGGELSESGVVTVTNLSWANSKMSGSGKTIVTGRMVLSGALVLNQHQLENAGIATWIGNSSFFSIINGASFINRAGATFSDLLTDGSYINTQGTVSQFVNNGTYIKDSPTSSAFFRLPFHNTGTVDLLTGGIQSEGGGSNSGIIKIAATTQLNLDNGYVLQPSTQLIGAGTLRLGVAPFTFGENYKVSGYLIVNGGAVTFSAPVTSRGILLTNGTATFSSTLSTPNVVLNGGKLTLIQNTTIPTTTISGGELSGSGVVTVTNLKWTRGVMSGSGKTIVTEGMVLDGSALALNQRQLENAGIATWIGSNAVFHINDGASFINRAGATFSDLITNGSYINTQGAVSQFVNNGTYIKNSQSSAFFRLPFHNTGTVDLLTGGIQSEGGGSNSGIIKIAAGTQLNLDNGYVLHPSTQLIGAGTLRLGVAPFTFGENYKVSGYLIVNGGAVTFSAPVTPTTVLLTNGTATFSSTLSTPNVMLNGGKLTLMQNTTIPTMTISGGELSGSGVVTVTNLVWTRGVMSGSGKTIVTGNMDLTNVSGSDELRQRQLENVGNASWTGNSVLYIVDNATFLNRVGATFTDAATTSAKFVSTAGNGQFVNNGTYIKSTTSNTYVYSLFNNSGALDIQKGAISLNSTSINSGTVNLATSTTLDINSAFTNQASGHISGTGTLDHSNAASFTNNGTIDPTVVVIAP